ncbi:unnamed protein product [Protopolystoma xenopodis]|uniref:PDZ domain-containing protein n=1 Tax=Protopolystoma xenopodis TaxID=117903 RepID=A0A3S5BKT8_9PLAT|nr:unnamed protein product [Protopolystoma xenopodis]
MKTKLTSLGCLDSDTLQPGDRIVSLNGSRLIHQGIDRSLQLFRNRLSDHESILVGVLRSDRLKKTSRGFDRGDSESFEHNLSSVSAPHSASCSSAFSRLPQSLHDFASNSDDPSTGELLPQGQTQLPRLPIAPMYDLTCGLSLTTTHRDSPATRNKINASSNRPERPPPLPPRITRRSHVLVNTDDHLANEDFSGLLSKEPRSPLFHQNLPHNAKYPAPPLPQRMHRGCKSERMSSRRTNRNNATSEDATIEDASLTAAFAHASFNPAAGNSLIYNDFDFPAGQRSYYSSPGHASQILSEPQSPTGSSRSGFQVFDQVGKLSLDTKPQVSICMRPTVSGELSSDWCMFSPVSTRKSLGCVSNDLFQLQVAYNF